MNDQRSNFGTSGQIQYVGHISCVDSMVHHGDHDVSQGVWGRKVA